MADNNTMYRMFRQMMQGYKLEKEGENLFVHAVHCWMDLNPDNPFPEDTEAFDCFFRMKNYYSVWKLHSADYRVNERRLIAAAKDLCATKPKNPYKYDKKEAEEDKIALRESTKKQQEEEINIQLETERLKAERDEEIRQILEELRLDDLENQNNFETNKVIIEQARADVINSYSKKLVEQKNIDEKKNYVFNVVEEPNGQQDEEQAEEPEKPEKEVKQKKKGFLSKLFRR